MFESERVFKMAVDRIKEWTIMSCPFTTTQLLLMAEGTVILDSAKTKNEKFLRVAPHYNKLNKSVVMDVVFGIDFLLEVDLGNENPVYLAIDVTCNPDILIKKVKHQRSKSRIALRERLGLDGFMIIGYDSRALDETGMSHGILSRLKKEVETSFKKGQVSCWVE